MNSGEPYRSVKYRTLDRIDEALEETPWLENAFILSKDTKKIHKVDIVSDYEADIILFNDLERTPEQNNTHGVDRDSLQNTFKNTEKNMPLKHKFQDNGRDGQHLDMN